MHRISKVLALWLCSGILAAAVAVAEPAPRAVVVQGEYDFGTVVEGTPVEHAFVVRNTGDAPLIFGKIHAG